MNVKEAVVRAKSYVAELLADESPSHIGLEEVEHDEGRGIWRVTVGFSRPWNTTRTGLTMLTGDVSAKRIYRVVTIRDKDNEITSFKRRDENE